MAPITLNSDPSGLRFTPDGNRLYVTLHDDNVVVMIDPATNALVGTPIIVGAYPIGLTINPDGSRVYVSNEDDGTISVIDTSDNSVVTTISNSNIHFPTEMEFTPDGTMLYVGTDSSDGLYRINPATNSYIDTIPVGSGNATLGLAFDPTGEKLYTTAFDEGKLGVVNVSDSDVTTLPVGNDPEGISISADGSRIYTANRSGSVTVVNTADLSIVTTISMPNTEPVSIGKFVGPELCGNDVLEAQTAGEACDDGNPNDGDGCSSDCAIEPGFACDGLPSSCQSTCGDGVTAANEACDDGNTVAGDGCSATCTSEGGGVDDATGGGCSLQAKASALPGQMWLLIPALSGALAGLRKRAARH